MNAARAAQAINYDAICGQIDLMVKRGTAGEESGGIRLRARGGLEVPSAADARPHQGDQPSHRKQVPGGTGRDPYGCAAKSHSGDKGGDRQPRCMREHCPCFSWVAPMARWRCSPMMASMAEHSPGRAPRGGGVAWKYSLDGGSSWTQLTAGETEVQLTDDQLESITAENDIKIQLIGANVVNSIDISKRELGRIMIEGNDPGQPHLLPGRQGRRGAADACRLRNVGAF